ncbi:MAG: 2'-5' RNA ligase family protein [Armatimonadetes bacterium]|nr:2'-5' RNA ligase family protein [Armatimonadota bacterium]
MGYAVEVYFDPQAEARVRLLWQRLADQGISSPLSAAGSRPHVSLAVFERGDPVRLREELAALVPRCPPLSLLFSSVGAFPTQEGVVFLAPVVTPGLLEVHRRFHGQLQEAGIRSLEHYRPGRWVPHCTVATNLAPAQTALAMEVCVASSAFGPATLTEIGLVEFRPVRSICALPLRALL